MSFGAATEVVASGARRIWSGRNAFLILKALNLVIITVYSFELVYVLVRILTLDLYPVAVLISSLGVYIMATDLGYSGFVYYRTRQSFLNHAKADGSEADVFLLYMAIALTAAVAMAIGIELSFTAPASIRIGLSLYFLSIVLALPWGLVRRIAGAVDLYLIFELAEVIRRLFFLIVAAFLLTGLPFAAFTLVCLAAWVIAFAGAIVVLNRQRKIDLLASSPAAIIAHLKLNYRNIGRSGSLTLVEFVIYNFPYITIPFLFTDKTLIVAFDIFYKIVRFGSVAYAVPADSFLPGQTRAFYANEPAGVVRSYRTVIGIGLLPLGFAMVVLFGFGDRIFTSLLSRGGVVDEPQRVAMAIMLAAVLLQTSAGTFLLGTGNYGRLAQLATITLALMAAAVGATWAIGLSFQTFMYLYVAVYCVHAMFYTVYFRRFLRSVARSHPPVRPAHQPE